MRHFVRWVFNLDLLEQLERMQAELERMEADRDAARCVASDAEQEIERLRKSDAMQRSLIGILRDVNRELDERNVSLEKRTPEGVARPTGLRSGRCGRTESGNGSECRTSKPRHFTPGRGSRGIRSAGSSLRCRRRR